MAFVNVHSLPGVTISVTYHEIDGTPVPSPTTPLSFSAGTYSLSTPQTQWAIAVFEVTSYGTGTIPVTGRITVTDIHVDGPYDGALGIGTGTTFSTRVASDGTPPDTPSADGAATASMDGSTRYFMVGHDDSGGSVSIQSIGSIVLEMDGDFVLPDFWQDFAITDEADGELHKLFEHSQFPGYEGQPYIAPVEQCWDDPPDPPGDGGTIGGGSSPPDPPNSGGGPGPPGEPMTCYGTGTHTCCVYPNGITICSPI